MRKYPRFSLKITQSHAEIEELAAAIANALREQREQRDQG
jgi:hypothetical protein